MSDTRFDPSKPFEVVEESPALNGGFDPLKPFEISVEDSGQSRPASVMNAFMQGGGTGMGQTSQGIARLMDFLAPGALMQEGMTEEAFRMLGRTGKEKEADIAKNPLYKLGGEIVEGSKEAYPTNPKFRGEFWSDTLPSSAGAMVPTIAATLAAGPIAAGLQYGTSQGQSEAQAAVDAGKEDEADKVFLLNLGIGAASEALLGVPANIMRYVRNARKAGVDKAVVKEVITKEIAKGALREAGQESLEQLGQNTIAKTTYDPNREITEGLAESAAAGFILGGGASAGAAGVGRLSRDKSAEEFNKQFDAASERTSGRRAIDAMASLNGVRVQTGVDDFGNPIYANQAFSPNATAGDLADEAQSRQENESLVDSIMKSGTPPTPPSGQPDATVKPAQTITGSNVRTGTEMPVQPQPIPLGRAAGAAIAENIGMTFSGEQASLVPGQPALWDFRFKEPGVEMFSIVVPSGTQEADIIKARDAKIQQLKESGDWKEAGQKINLPSVLEVDIERYNQLVSELRGAPIEQRFAMSQEIERIKNKYGGKPPALSSLEIPKEPTSPAPAALNEKKATPPKGVEQVGAAVVVSSGKPNGSKVEVQYEVVEAASLKPSIVRDVSLDQTRQRTGNAASDEQIAKIATAPDISLLAESPTSTVGAPILDDVVIAGNGRVSGIIAGYEGGTKGSHDYRRGVVESARRLGLGDVSGMVNPVLIRRVKRYVSGDKASFVVESNPKYAALKESAAEAALLDAQAIGDIGALPFNDSGSLTAAGVQQVARLLDTAQRNLTRSVGGDFDANEANKRVQLAALATLAKESNVSITDLIGLIESDDGRRVMGEVTRVAPRLQKLDADLRVGGYILKGMRELQSGIASVRDGHFTSLDEWYNERKNELLKSGLDSNSEGLLKVMVASQKKPTVLRELFNDYLKVAEYEQNQRKEAGQTQDIFGESRKATTPEEIFTRVFGQWENGGQPPIAGAKPGESEARPVTPTAAPKPATPPPAPTPARGSSITDSLAASDKATLENLKAQLRQRLSPRPPPAAGGLPSLPPSPAEGSKPQGNLSGDPEAKVILAQITALYAKAGVKRFAEYAQHIKSDLPDLWDGIKGYLHGAWNTAAVDYPTIEEISRADAASVIAGEKQPTLPTNENKPTTPKKPIAQENPTGPKPVVGGDGKRPDVGKPVGGGDGAGNSANAKPTLARITTARPQLTKEVEAAKVIPQDLIVHLDEHQQQNAAKAILSMDEVGGFLDASGTGVGKTRISLTTAENYRRKGKRVIIVTKAETLTKERNLDKNLFRGSYYDDSNKMGVKVRAARSGDVAKGEIVITTYENLDWVMDHSDSDTVLIFDEAHAIKNVASIRSKSAMRGIESASKVFYLSATPADKPTHIHYLARMGSLEGKTQHEQFTDLGLSQFTFKQGKKEITVWGVNPKVGEREVLNRFEALFDRLTERGRMVKREIAMDGVEVGIERIKLSDETHKKMQEIDQFFGGLENARGLKVAQILMHQRRQQEPDKIPHVLKMIRDETAEGRQVVVFLHRVNESEVNRKRLTGYGMDGAPEFITETLMSSQGTAKTLRAELLKAGFTESDIAELHGGAEGNVADSVTNFNSGKAKIIIATIESGGTGINLDDRTGDSPRTMIIMTPPFDAVGNVQAAGRIWRLKTKSYPRIKYVLGNTDVDEWNASIIGSKMKQLGATVMGEVSRLDITDPDIVSLDDFTSQKKGDAKQGDAAFPKLEWKQIKTRDGRTTNVANIQGNDAFWQWWDAAGKKENALGVSISKSKYDGQWQAWANEIPKAETPTENPVAPVAETIGTLTPDEAVKSGVDRGDYYRAVQEAFKAGAITDSQFQERSENDPSKWPKFKIGQDVFVRAQWSGVAKVSDVGYGWLEVTDKSGVKSRQSNDGLNDLSEYYERHPELRPIAKVKQETPEGDVESLTRSIANLEYRMKQDKARGMTRPENVTRLAELRAHLAASSQEVPTPETPEQPQGMAAGSKVHLKGPGGKWNNGTKEDGGDNLGTIPMPWTIVSETTDPKFPDERTFRIRNDRTKETTEVDFNKLVLAKNQNADDRANRKTKPELQAELVKLNPAFRSTIKDYSIPELRDMIKREKAKKKGGDDPVANLGTGLEEGQGWDAAGVREAIKGENTAGFPVRVISKEEAVNITGAEEAFGYGGFFYKGTVYLVAGNIKRGSSGFARQVLREEVGHGLLRTAEGNRLFAEALKAGRLNLTEQEKQALLKEGYLDEGNQLLDEFIAKSARENRKWWQDLVARVVRFLKGKGFKATNEEAARALLRQIRRAGKEATELNASAVPASRSDSLSVEEINRINRELNTLNEKATKTAGDNARIVELERQLGQQDLFTVPAPDVEAERRKQQRAEIERRQNRRLVAGQIEDQGGLFAEKKAATQADMFSVPSPAKTEAPPATARKPATDLFGELAPSRAQQTFGAEIGESREVENIREIQAALVENGYGVGDTVTPENTAQAWRQFVGFVDPNTRTEWLNQLRQVVPQEMAPGILQSELWKYAIRLASQGNPALFRAMAQNSNHFIMGTGDAFRSTFGRGLRALKLGSEFTTWKNELERSKEQRRAIARQLGVAPDLIDLLVDNLNGARPEVAPIVTTVAETPLPDGQTVRDVLDLGDAPTQTPEEVDEQVHGEQASRANATAAEFLRRLELDYAGVEWLRRNSPARTTVQTILRDHYASESPILPIEGNTNRIIQELAARFENEVDVSPDIARQLAVAAEVKRQSDWTNARARAIGRAATSKNLRSLVEDILASPYLAQSDPDWIKNTAKRWFMSNGLSQEQATGAAAILEREFRQKLYEAQAKAAEKLLQKAKPENAKDFLQALRAGLFDPDKPWAETFAARVGMRSPTKEQFQRLASLELSLHDGNLTAPERAQVIEEMMGIYLHLKLPPPLISRIASNFVVTSLTGLRTGTVNIFAPIARLLTETALKTAIRPQDTLRNLKTLLEAYKDLPRRVQFSLTKDAYTFINNEYEQSTNEMRRIWETAIADMESGVKWKQARGALKTLWGSQQFFMRLLNSLDQANAVSEREVQMVNYGSAAFREAGLSSSHVTALVEATSRLKQAAYDDAINRLKLKPDQARVHADETAFEELERFIADEIGGEKGQSKAAEARDAAEQDAYSAIGRLSQDTVETDEGGFVSRNFYHKLLEISNLFRRGKGVEPILGVSLLGYVSIPIRTARYIAWNSPYGLIRLGIHHLRKSKGLENQWKQSLATEAQEKHRLKMALAASASLALLAALGFKLLKSSDDDDAGDDEMGMYVTGRGPKNKQLQDAWEKKGFRDNSLILFFNKKPIAIPLTRLGEPLSHLVWPLAARDDYNWRKKEAEAAGKDFKETWNATTGYAMGTYIGLLGQRGVFQNISYWAKLGSGEGGTEKILADLASKTASNAFIPWMGMQRSLTSIAEGKLDKSSIQSVVGANLGIIGLGLQKPAINRFGDKLGNRTWYGIIADTGVPVAFQTENTPENEKFYGTLAQKGISPPELQRRVVEKRYGELTDNQFQDFAQKSGNILKQTIQKNLPAIQKMSPEQADKFITNAAQQADRIAASALALKPVPKVELSPATTPNPVAAPAAASPPRSSQATPVSSPTRQSSAPSIATPRAPSGRVRSSLASFKTPKLKRPSGRIRSRISRGFRRIRSSRARSSRGRLRTRMGLNKSWIKF